MEFNECFAYYECSLCGHRMQVLKIVQVEVENEYGEIEIIDVLDFDGDASFQLVLEHEEGHE